MGSRVFFAHNFFPPILSVRPEIFPAAIVLKMSKNEVAEFWQEQANSGRLIPSVAGALFIHQIQKTQMNGFFLTFFIFGLRSMPDGSWTAFERIFLKNMKTSRWFCL